MPDLHHAIWIDRPPKAVFEALATREGLESWWTANVEQEGEGEDASWRFGFDGDQVHFTMETADHQPGRRLAWDCTGEVDEWAGTRLVFELEDDGEGTWLSFDHRGWADVDPYFAQCNTTWGQLMYVLKGYLEGDEPGPLFQG